MAEENSTTDIFIKEGASQEAPSYKSASASITIEAPAERKSEGIGVENLRSLDKDTIDGLLLKKSVYEKKIQTAFAEKAIPAGIYKIDGNVYFVCPEDFFKEDDTIGQLIADFANTTGAVIKLIPGSVERTPLVDEKFILGLWFGLSSSSNQKRRKGKTPYELGRTCTFSLIVKNMFESTKELGVRALTKDNFFFGNNQGEMSGNSSVPFFIKAKLRSYFNNPLWGDLIYGIINFTAAFVGFKYLTEEEADRVVADHLIPIDQLITSCYPSTTLKRGRQTVTKVKKPNAIRSSPLYTNEEMEIISLVTSCIFTELGDLQKDYEKTVFSIGFSALEARIREVIRLRWETLQRFSNRTKLRLQAIRKIVNNPTLKKANVTQDQVNQLLDNYPTPASTLVSDIKHILGGTSLVDCLSYAYKRGFESDKIAVSFLTHKVIQLYRRYKPSHPWITSQKSFSEIPDVVEIDVERGNKCYIQLRNVIGDLKKQTLGFNNLQEFKLFGRIKQINALYEKTNLYKTEIQSLPRMPTNLAIRLSSDGLYKNVDDVIAKINDALLKNATYLLNAAGWHLRLSSSKEVKSLLEQFKIFIDNQLEKL
jgi:hypothetical protein